MAQIGPCWADGAWDVSSWDSDAWGSVSVVTDPLTIDGTVVRVAVGGHAQDRIPLGQARRSFGGYMRSGITSTRGHVRVWTIQTVMMDRSDAITLESTLVAPGTVSVSGTLVGGSALDCYAVGVERRDSDTLLYASLSFQLLAAET